MVIPMIIKRDDYIIRDLEFKDALFLRKWGSFDDPILYGYNYADLTDSEIRYWYNSKRFPFRAQYYVAINNKGHMIGYMGMKEINRFTQSSKLGIVLDPNYVSKGYGTRLLRDFLDYYFNELKMTRMILEVNRWNKRAISLYEKMGFKEYATSFQRFENQKIDLEDPSYARVRDCFEIRNGRIYNEIIKMSLSRRDYLDGKGGKP